MKLINIGFGNMINADRMIAVVSPESAPVRRLMQTAKENGLLLDVTQGRKTAGVIITDTDYIILSYLKPEKIAQKADESADEPITNGEKI